MTGVLAATIAMLVVVAYVVTEQALTATTDTALEREAAAFSAAMRGAPDEAALADATRAYLEGRTGGETGLAPILLVAFNRPDGGWRVISNSELRIEDAAGNTELQSPTGQATFATIDFEGTSYRILSVPVVAQGTNAGVFQAALSQQAIANTAQQVALTLMAAGAFALAAGLPLSYLATRRALRPLTLMAADAEAISHREHGRRITFNGPPHGELGSLASALNDMLDRLERAYDDQRRFVADASHELRTPVAVIRGNVELLRSGNLCAEESAEGLAVIEDESIRMGRLLDELLALARLEDGSGRPFQPLEVRTLVDEVAYRGKSLGDRVFSTEGDCGLWIEGDPDLLAQAFVNVVKNAVSHTEDGGHVTLACRTEGDRVLISITDDGPGLTEAELERVFDRFYRAQGVVRGADGSGAGLGLAITRRLVELHGGAIGADNVKPHGARFTISLPRLEEPPTPS